MAQLNGLRSIFLNKKTELITTNDAPDQARLRVFESSWLILPPNRPRNPSELSSSSDSQSTQTSVFPAPTPSGNPTAIHPAPRLPASESPSPQTSPRSRYSAPRDRSDQSSSG